MPESLFSSDAHSELRRYAVVYDTSVLGTPHRPHGLGIALTEWAYDLILVNTQSPSTSLPPTSLGILRMLDEITLAMELGALLRKMTSYLNLLTTNRYSEGSVCP